MTDRAWQPWNGRSTMVSRIIEALVVAAIVGGLSIWGNAKMLDVKIENLCTGLGKVEARIEKIADRLDDHLLGR